MLRVVLRSALVALVFTGACGEPPKIVKHPKKTQPQKNSKALINEARDDAKNGDIDAADKAYADAYAADKSFDTLEEYVADFLLHSGRSSKAIDLAKTYVGDNIADPKGYNLLAEAQLAAGNGKEALDAADQLLQLKGNDDPAGHEKKGRALVLLEKTHEGVEELRQAVTLDPKSATYHKALGEALANAEKNFDAAALEFRAAIKADPNDPEAHVLLGMALRNQNELDEAKSYLDKAIELDPRSGRAYFELGLLYNIEKKQADAEQALSKAIQLAPNDSLFWYAYGEIFRVQERDDDAIKAYRQAVQLDPPYPKALLKLGMMLVDRKQYDEAEGLLTQALRRDSHAVIALFYLGILHQAQNKPRLALDNYEQFIKQAPKGDELLPKARQAMESLKRHR
ncbi:MAG: tetratricopeptide repeat protein [Acidobacteriota bacterium]